MKPHLCDQETALLEAILAGRWPEGCESDLRAHVAQCSICADVALVAQTLHREHDGARAVVAVPAAGLVWWKAQMKARREAVKRASEPIALVESAAGIFGVAALVALAIGRWDWVCGWLAWLKQLPNAGAFRPRGLWPGDAVASFQSFSFLIIASATACLLLVLLVLYFFLAED